MLRLLFQLKDAIATFEATPCTVHFFQRSIKPTLLTLREKGTAVWGEVIQRLTVLGNLETTEVWLQH